MIISSPFFLSIFVQSSNNQKPLKNLYLKYRQEVKTTFELALPIIVGQLGIMLMGLADTIQVGHMEDGNAAHALGASGMANSIYITIAIIGYITLQVVAPMVSKAEAQRDYAHCYKLLKASLRVAVLMALLCGTIIGLLAWQYEVFRQPSENERLAPGFLYIIMVSILPSFIFTATKSFTDGLSKTRVAMVITVTALLLNIILNYFLINGIWIFPKWGLNGAGVSTLFSRIYMACAILIYVYRGKEFKKFFEKKEKWLPDSWNLELEILRIGVPSGFQGFFEIATFSMAVVMMGWLGVYQQAAHMVAINMASLTYMASTGIAAAGGIRVGSGLGLRDRSAILRSGSSALMIVLFFMGSCAVIMFSANDWLVSLYTKDINVAQIAVSLVIWGCFFQLFDGVQCVSLGILRGIQDVNIPTGITVFAYWVIGIPMSYFFAFTLKMDAPGVWVGLTLSLVTSACLLSWRFYNKVKLMEL